MLSFDEYRKHLDSIFNESFFSFPSAEKLQTKEISCIPTDDDMQKEGENPDLMFFLQSPKGEEFRQVVFQIIDKLKKWVIDHNLGDDYQNAIEEFSNKFSPEKEQGTIAFVLYTEGIPVLSTIVEQTFEKTLNPSDESTINEMILGLGVCSPGVLTNINKAFLALNTDFTVQLMDAKRILAEQAAADVLKPYIVTQISDLVGHPFPVLRGNEIHYANILINLFSEHLGILPIKDEFVDEASVRNYLPLMHQFAKKLIDYISAEKIVDIIVEKILNDIRYRIEHDNGVNISEIEDKLSVIGTDNLWLTGLLFDYDSENDKTILNKMAKLHLTVTIYARLCNSDYFLNLYKKIVINDEITIFYIPNGDFKSAYIFSGEYNHSYIKFLLEETEALDQETKDKLYQGFYNILAEDLTPKELYIESIPVLLKHLINSNDQIDSDSLAQCVNFLTNIMEDNNFKYLLENYIFTVRQGLNLQMTSAADYAFYSFIFKIVYLHKDEDLPQLFLDILYNKKYQIQNASLFSTSGWGDLLTLLTDLKNSKGQLLVFNLMNNLDNESLIEFIFNDVGKSLAALSLIPSYASLIINKITPEYLCVLFSRVNLGADILSLLEFTSQEQAKVIIESLTKPQLAIALHRNPRQFSLLLNFIDGTFLSEFIFEIILNDALLTFNLIIQKPQILTLLSVGLPLDQLSRLLNFTTKQFELLCENSDFVNLLAKNLPVLNALTQQLTPQQIRILFTEKNLMQTFIKDSPQNIMTICMISPHIAAIVENYLQTMDVIQLSEILSKSNPNELKDFFMKRKNLFLDMLTKYVPNNDNIEGFIHNSLWFAGLFGEEYIINLLQTGADFQQFVKCMPKETSLEWIFLLSEKQWDNRDGKINIFAIELLLSKEEMKTFALKVNLSFLLNIARHCQDILTLFSFIEQKDCEAWLIQKVFPFIDRFLGAGVSKEFRLNKKIEFIQQVNNENTIENILEHLIENIDTFIQYTIIISARNLPFEKFIPKKLILQILNHDSPENLQKQIETLSTTLKADQQQQLKNILFSAISERSCMEVPIQVSQNTSTLFSGTKRDKDEDHDSNDPNKRKKLLT